jgi:hypothetical protein
MEPTEVELRDFLAKADRLFHARADVVAGTRRRKAPGFNIFSLTTWSDIEVRTHQKFLAYLLDPTQAHEQGNLFLEPFLKLISDRTGIPLPTPNTIWSVTQGTHDIDVLLRHQDSGQSVVVEVKWMASEHRREQLYSYWRRERDRTKKARVPAVYLTRFGEQPSLPTIDSSNFELDIVRVSYKNDLTSLFEESLRKIVPSRVREVVQQYLEVLYSLKGDQL